jgi:hypothetical protein
LQSVLDLNAFDSVFMVDYFDAVDTIFSVNSVDAVDAIVTSVAERSRSVFFYPQYPKYQ